jgi:TolB-like protein/class 3 adenylate cyclase/Flp pilus assembly protein TadD
MDVSAKLSRRLAAVAVADVAGYSRLMRLDEEGTFRRWSGYLSRAEALLGASAGRIVKTTGDGFVAEIPSAVEAARALLAWLGEIGTAEMAFPPERRITVRIGLHLGDVIVAEDGDIYGDGVNLAARLEPLAPPGTICVDEATRSRIDGRIEATTRPLGNHRLKNIDQPARLFALHAPGAGSETRPRRRVLLVAGLAAAALAGLIGLAAHLWRGEPSPTLSAHPEAETARLSVVVLPFSNSSGDPADAVYADAFTDDLVTDLSRIADAFVISSNTSFTLKGRPVDVRQLSRELKVRFAVSGAVRREDEAIRVSASLIEADSGRVLWSDRYDRTRATIRTLQQDVTGQIARTLNLQIKQAASLRRFEQGGNLDANDYALRAWAELWTKPQSKATNDAALQLIAQSLAIDPDNADALAAQCYALTRAGRYGWLAEPARVLLERAIRAGERAVALDPRDADAVFVLAFAVNTAGDLERALTLYRNAQELNPNHAPSFANYGWVQTLLGRPGDALPWIERAFAISPRDPLIGIWHSSLALSAILMGSDEMAVREARTAIAHNPNNPPPYLHAAVGLWRLNQRQEAEAMMERHRAIRPGWTIAKQRASARGSDAYERLERPVLAVLRELGLPEE